MIRKLKIWLGVTAFFWAVAVSTTGWTMGPPGGMHPNPARMIAHMNEHLELSPEQQSEVASLLAAAEETTAADRQRLRELHGQMRGMREGFDEETARGIADEIGRITGRMVYQASVTWSQVYRLLDAQQKAELESLETKRREHRGKWHERSEKTSQQVPG